MTQERILDLEISPLDFVDLSGGDAVAALFSRLGYDTNRRVAQTTANLGLGAETVVRPIRTIELIADQEGLLQVYLFELASVTVTHTRALARSFRNRAGNYLLVLTSDYERLDFVLVEKYLPADAEKAGGIGQKQVAVRPRVLTVNRRNPDAVHLRVLRRFTYTESDPFFQYDKILSAYSVAEWSEQYFNNRALFSDYYLLKRLPQHTAWSDDPKPVYAQLSNLYQSASSRFSRKAEETIRADLLEPVFRLLGFAPRTGKRADSHDFEPDYRLFTPSNKSPSPLALCLAYPWGRSLDGKDDQRDKETSEENPGALVVSLLEKGEAPWVIVTNGKHWRLYARRSHSRATNYYEVDLEETLADSKDPATAFRYFWLLFRLEAFEAAPVEREGETVPLCLLDNLYLESQDYARELGESLKARVFEEVFPHLAKGFVHSLRETKGKNVDLSQDALDAIFRGTLTLLYRLLFLLYAESRDLLPVREVRGYWAASLTRMKREIAEAAGTIADEVEKKLAKHYSEAHYGLYDGLSRLFSVVDKGEAALNVPFYNGGLFLSDPRDDDTSPEAEAARFLRDTKAPDRQLAVALDLLARDIDRKRLDLAFIDYKSLDVRQLGSIYEGLLEFRLRTASEKLAVRKEKSREVYAPFKEMNEKEQAQAEKRGLIIHKGALYLENDKRERKASGSYYTPDHIVAYIVENAVGPVLREKFEALRPKLREAQQKRKAFFDKQKALAKNGITPEPESKADLDTENIVGQLFDIKVLDPAMGSGHFLVEAVDFITDKMLDFLNAFPWNPVQAHLARMRRQIHEEMERQEITIAENRLTDVHLLKRHVLKRCIYGVDLNPMAVELAKVSLWLDCFTLGAPLSFLDHHVKCGNSLIGATVEEAKRKLEGEGVQLDILYTSRFQGLLGAAENMREVSSLADITFAQVAESRSKFHQALGGLAPFKRTLDMYVSQWFGNTAEAASTIAAIRKPAPHRKGGEAPPPITFLRTPGTELFCQARDDGALRKVLAGLTPEFRAMADRALQDAQRHRFFHWDLEFPEVFYGPRARTQRVVERVESGGFDAIVGNPPYIRQEALGDLKRYLEDVFPVYHGIADIYAYFYNRGQQMLRPGGRFSMITSNKFMRANYGAPLRKFLSENVVLEDIVDFGELPLFKDAATFPCIVTFRKPTPRGTTESGGSTAALPPITTRFTQVKSLAFSAVKEVVDGSAQILGPGAFSGANWSLGTSDEVSILRKMEATGIPLIRFLMTRGAHIRRGVLTGLNEAFVLDRATRDALIAEDLKLAEIIKPLIVGDDVRRYRINFRERYLIWTYIGVPIQRYPAVFRHLRRFQPQLEKRWDKGKHWWELRACDYYEDFEKPKIVYPDMGMECRFCMDAGGFYTSNTTYLIAPGDWHLLALLDSAPALFYFKSVCSVLGDEERRGRLRFFGQFLERLPIPAADKNAENRLAELAKRRTELEAVRPPLPPRGKRRTKTPTPPEIAALDREIDAIVAALYGLTEKELDVITRSGSAG